MRSPEEGDLGIRKRNEGWRSLQNENEAWEALLGLMEEQEFAWLLNLVGRTEGY